MTSNPKDHREYTAYDPLRGGIVQKTGPNGIHSCTTYDVFGRQITQTERCGTGDHELTTTTDRFVNDSGDPQWTKVVTRTRRPDGVASWSFADALGRETYVRGRTFAGGYSETFVKHDLWGRRFQESMPRNAFSVDATYLTTTTFDELDRVRTITRDIGSIDGTPLQRRSIQTQKYEGMAVITYHNVDGDDPQHTLQQRRKEWKNVFGKVGYVEDVNFTQIAYWYDADGNLTDTVEGGHDTHIQIEKKRGRREWMRDPDLGRWQYTYNEFGELATQTDAAGKTVSMTYDKLGRMTSKRNDQTGQEAKWAYDDAPGAGKGKLAAMVSEPDDVRLRGPCDAAYGLPSGEKRAVRSFSYNALGEVQLVDDCVDGETFSTNHTYDNRGRESVTTYPVVGSSRLSVRYNYTSLGFLWYVSDAADTTLYWAAMARDPSGRVTSEYMRNGVETTTLRNQATGWMQGSQSVSHADNDTLIQNWAYHFDEVGNLRDRLRSDAVNGPTSVETFTYDALNRLHTSTVYVGTESPTVETYDYDVRGNIEWKAGKHYTYGAAGGCATGGPHAVCTTIDGGPQFEYDANGNLENDGNRLIRWDLANKVTRIQSGGNFADFIYGADGNRVVQETSGGGHTARTIYVGLGATGRSLFERTRRDDGTVEDTHFLYAPGEHNGNAFAIKVAHGMSLSSPTMSFNHFDHLGSVTAVSDEQGQVVNAAWGGANATVAGYDPWGARRSPDGHSADPSSFQPLPGHREFTGHETIPGVGLINMNGRVYDPMIGRFLSPDPNVQFVGDLQSYNRYSYVLNNPLRYTDPTGYFLDSPSEVFGYVLALAAVVCTAATDGGCGPFAVIALTAYNAGVMAANGTPFDQIVAVTAVSLAASYISGGLLGAAAAGDKSIVAAMIIGGTSSVMSQVMTTAVLGGDLGGEQLLTGALVGAVFAGVAAGLSGAPLVSQAQASEAQGESEQVAAVRRFYNRLHPTGRPLRVGELPDIDPAVFEKAGTFGRTQYAYRLTASARKDLDPLFARYGTDLSKVLFKFDPSAVQSHTSGNLVTLGSGFAGLPEIRATTLIHELVHVAQGQILGGLMGVRGFNDMVNFGFTEKDLYAIRPGLAAKTLETINIVDLRFSLESIAEHFEDLAWASGKYNNLF
jgi:RHS repeat-associated protein